MMLSQKVLTTTEINDLKAIRATYIVNADLTELKAFFAKYSMALSIDKNINIERTFKIIYENYDSSRNLNGFTDAYILRIFNIAKNTDFTACIKAVADKAFLYLHDYSSFDATNFVLDNNFLYPAWLTTSNLSTTDTTTHAINVAIGMTRV